MGQKEKEIMTMQELYCKYAELTNLTKAESKKRVTQLFDVLREALTNGEDVSIPHLGTFKTVERAARKGRNPKSGEQIDIEPSKTIKFKPCVSLREQVNE